MIAFALGGIAIGLVAASLVGAMYGIGWVVPSHKLRFRHLDSRFRALSVKSVADLEEGELARLVGRVRIHESTLSAPLSGRACALYVVRALADRHLGETAIAEQTPLDRAYRREGRDFVLEDESGRVLVRGGSAHAHVVSDLATVEVPNLEQRAAKFLDSEGALVGGDERLRYAEGVIEPGEEVTVLGRVGTTIGFADGGKVDGGDYREPPRQLVIEAPPGDHVIVSDDPYHAHGDASIRSRSSGAEAPLPAGWVLAIVFGPLAGWAVGGTLIGEYHAINWERRLIGRCILAAGVPLALAMIHALRMGLARVKTRPTAIAIITAIAAATCYPAMHSLITGPTTGVATVVSSEWKCRAFCFYEMTLDDGSTLRVSDTLTDGVPKGPTRVVALRDFGVVLSIGEHPRRVVELTGMLYVALSMFAVVAVLIAISRWSHRRGHYFRQLSRGRTPWLCVDLSAAAPLFVYVALRSKPTYYDQVEITPAFAWSCSSARGACDGEEVDIELTSAWFAGHLPSAALHQTQPDLMDKALTEAGWERVFGDRQTDLFFVHEPPSGLILYRRRLAATVEVCGKVQGGRLCAFRRRRPLVVLDSEKAERRASLEALAEVSDSESRTWGVVAALLGFCAAVVMLIWAIGITARPQ